jgi:hypothetical protein
LKMVEQAPENGSFDFCLCLFVHEYSCKVRFSFYQKRKPNDVHLTAPSL